MSVSGCLVEIRKPGARFVPSDHRSQAESGCRKTIDSLYLHWPPTCRWKRAAVTVLMTAPPGGSAVPSKYTEAWCCGPNTAEGIISTKLWTDWSFRAPDSKHTGVSNKYLEPENKIHRATLLSWQVDSIRYRSADVVWSVSSKYTEPIKHR